MYEVFLNECRLCFTSGMNILFKHNIYQTVDIEDIVDFFALLSAIESEPQTEGRRLVCRISPDLLKILPENLTQILAAGGLVTNRQDRFLFIRRRFRGCFSSSEQGMKGWVMLHRFTVHILILMNVPC